MGENSFDIVKQIHPEYTTHSKYILRLTHLISHQPALH